MEGGNVTSLVMALKLKNAGLPWEPKTGDVYYQPGEDMPFLLCVHAVINENLDNATFAPRLDQLLEFIEGRGYLVDSEQRISGYLCSLLKHKDGFGIISSHITNTMDTRTDAAAEAVLWLLEREKP
jgi:hypothetical protein